MPRAAESPTRSPVKLPGPVVTATRSSAAKAMPDLLHDARDQRHQRFGMAALHGLRFPRDHLAGLGIEHARGAGIQRGIDGEDQHGEVVRQRTVDSENLRSRHSSFATHYSLSPDHIGRTSTTSGTKCFSRFWMPCCSVAVEDGQPAQEPFMLR